MIIFTNENPVSLDIREEFLELLQEHYCETAPYDDYELDIDWDAYSSMYESGIVEFFVGRDENQKIVAYCLYIVCNSPHFKSKTLASMDSIYVEPALRRKNVAAELLSFCEEYLLEERGVDLVTLEMKASAPFREFATKAGYEEMDYIYTKKLGVL